MTSQPLPRRPHPPSPSRTAPAPSRRPGIRGLRWALSVLCLSAAWTSAVHAADYYMAPNGDDEAPGTLAAPWASAARFAQIAEPGDTLFIRGGVYRAQETILTRSGEQGRPITFRNYQDEVPIFDGTDTHYNAAARYPNAFYSDHTHYVRFIDIEGVVVRNYFRGGIHLGSNYVAKSLAQTNDHIRIRNCLIDNCGQNGITIFYGDWAVVENCMVSRTGWSTASGSWSSNINLYNMVGPNNRVTGNVSFHAVDVSDRHTDGNGMILDMFEGPPGAGATVEGNLFFENGGVGIAWTRCQNAKISHNTLWDNAREPTFIHPGCGIYFWDATTDIDLRNNIIWQTDGGDAMQQNTPLKSGTREGNLITRQPGAADPLLTDPAALDFTPRPTSPARAAADAPAKSAPGALVFDPKSVKRQSTEQPVAWYRWAPDLDYLRTKGGLRHCLATVPRPPGRTELGAVAVLPPAPAPALASTAQLAAGNLLVNGGFEVPPKQWELAKNAVVLPAAAYRGSAGLRIEGTASWSSSSQIVPVEPNTAYVFSAWIKGTCNVNLKVVTPAWATIADGVQIPTDTWTRYQVRFNSGPNSVVLIALMDGSRGTSLVDTVTLTKE